MKPARIGDERIEGHIGRYRTKCRKNMRVPGFATSSQHPAYNIPARPGVLSAGDLERENANDWMQNIIAVPIAGRGRGNSGR
jgi:hypothetical protein